MINWLKPSLCAVPTNYPCLMLIDDGTCVNGIYKHGMSVIAWTVINKPAWMMIKTGRGAGKVSGENHPKARLTDADCDLIRTAYATGDFSYQQLSDKFESSKSTIRDIIKYRSRLYQCG